MQDQQANEVKTKVNSIEEVFKLSIPILKKFGVTRAYLFGSFAKRCHGDDSDVDILVEFYPEVEEKMNIMDMVHLTDALETSLGRKVDVVQENFLLPLIGISVKATKLLLFE